MKGKRILFVGNTAWSMFNFRMNIMDSIVNSGGEVIVVAPEDEYAVKIRERGISFISIKLDSKGTSPIKDLSLLVQLYRIYSRLAPDFIFHYTIKLNIFGSFAAGRLGIKNIAFVTGAGQAFSEVNFLTKIVKMLFRIALRYPEEVWFLNNDDYNLFVSNGIVSNDKCKILPGEGINTRVFDTDKPVNEKFKTFLFFSRLLWAKGVGIYVDAARGLKAVNPELEFHLLGFVDSDNPESVTKDQLDIWVEEGVVSYFGATANVRTFIESADCVVLPSFYREGIPRTLLEAASLKRPIITTDNVGCRDVIEDYVTGYLCRVKDVTDLFNKMEMMSLLSFEERSKMGNKAREKIKAEFEESIIVDIYKSTLDRLFLGQQEPLLEKNELF